MTADWIVSICDLSIETIRSQWGTEPFTVECFAEALIASVAACNRLRADRDQLRDEVARLEALLKSEFRRES